MISHRAQAWNARDPFLVKAHFACAADPYDPASNPNGYINLGTAENKTLYDHGAPLLRECLEIHEDDTHYSTLHGPAFVRRAIAEFLSPRAGRSISADHLAVGAATSAILENLSFVLCDPGDIILIPTPYYPGFDQDLVLRSGAVFAHIPLPAPRFELTLDAVGQAYTSAARHASQAGRKVRALLLTSPHNPLGVIYPESLLKDLQAFCEGRRLHMIVDEIYAESVLPEREHISALRLESEWVHVVYGFAKDFGLSGYKVGLVHSLNETVMRSLQAGCYFYTVSGLVHRLIANLLRHPGLPDYLATMRRRLAGAREEVVRELSRCGVRHHPLDGSIVMWLNLKPYLKHGTFEAERALFEEMLGECRVSLPPGQAFHCSEPGWFRMCYTASDAHRREGVARLVRYLGAR